jgi:hypothetical protein
MHEMHDEEELNITVREAIAERDFVGDDEEVEEEVVDSDNEEDHHNITVEDDDVDSDDDNHEHTTVAPGGEDHYCFVAEHQLEWYPDWYAQVYPEWYYSTFATNMEGCDCVDVEVDVEPSPLQLECSGSVWKDGRRRSARLLAKKGDSKDEPLLGSTVDHLGRRRSLRLQQKKR